MSRHLGERGLLLIIFAPVFASSLLAQARPSPALDSSATRSAATAPAPKPRVWLDPDGKLLPFASDEAVLEFLRTARVVSAKDIPVGVTAPQKLLLEKDGIRANAHFSFIDEDKPVATLRGGKREVGFRDSYRFQAAAYELALLLGMDNVPPAVPRTLSGRHGAVSIWIEKTMTERDRIKNKVNPPRPMDWIRQKENMHVFDNLIYNTDRNQGNILIDEDWKLWMIDHTRAFRRVDNLLEPPSMGLCGKTLWQRLQEVSDSEIEARLKPHLTRPEINSLLKRRVKIVAFLNKLIQEKGEGSVLFKE